MSEPTDQPPPSWTPPGGPPPGHPHDQQAPQSPYGPAQPPYGQPTGGSGQPPYGQGGPPPGQPYGTGQPPYDQGAPPPGQPYRAGQPPYDQGTPPPGQPYGPGQPPYGAGGPQPGGPYAPGGGWQGQPPGPGQYGAGPWGAYPPPPGRNRRGLIVGLIAAAALALIVVAGVAVILSKGGSGGGTITSKGGGSAAQPGIPATRQADGSIALAEPGVTHPVLELYEDFQCPVCKSFEDSSGATIRDLVRQGKVKVVYRPFRLFEQEPLRSNSARAANAAACAPAGQWLALHDLLFQNQPAEGSAGFSTTELQQLGRQAGITDSAFASCVAGDQKSAEVESATSSALASGVQGTPTGRLNGADVSNSKLFSPDGLRAAITGGSGGDAPSGQPSSV